MLREKATKIQAMDKIQFHLVNAFIPYQAFSYCDSSRLRPVSNNKVGTKPDELFQNAFSNNSANSYITLIRISAFMMIGFGGRHWNQVAS